MNSKSDIFAKFCSDRNVKIGTVKSYVSAIQKYEEFIGHDIETIICDALKEEELSVPLKNRKIKTDLLEYRYFLFESNMSANTVKTYFSKLKTFLKHFEIEIPVLPDAQYNKTYETCYLDLPTKEHIAKVLNMVTIDLKAIILFMASSGTAKAETLALTVGDFFKATSKYHNGGTVDEILRELSNRRNMIPTFYLKRIKTDKYYYTFCSPEASEAIVDYLTLRDNLKFSDQLFEFSDSQLLNKFQTINDKMNWGFKGNYRFFRSHTLRKFHASNIGLVAEHVDALQGRTKNSIHETYIKTNPKELRDLYKKVVENVTFFPEEKRPKHVNEEFHITINVFVSGSECNLL